jgi:hypothetical protein
LSLGPVAPADRSRTLARSLAQALSTAADAAANAPLAPPPPTAHALEPTPWTPATWRVGTALGAAWEPALGDAPGRLGVDAELLLAGLGERLQLGLRIGWRPTVSEPAASVPSDTQALYTDVRAGWGWRFGALEARADLGLALTWRRLRSRPPGQSGGLTADDLGLAVPLEARLRLWVTRGLALEGAVGGRVYLVSAGRTWLGDAVVDAPRGAVEAALRLVWWWSR